MSKELKIGFITLVTLITMIWGFQYMKGKNFLKKGYHFETILSNVEGLEVASVVEINGLPVGAISSIEVNPDNVRTMIVGFDIEGDFRLPKNTMAINAAPTGVIGSRKIILDFDYLCEGDDCLQGGERLESSVRGLIATLTATDDIDGLISNLRKELGPMMDTVVQRLTSTDEGNTIGSSLHNIDEMTRHMASLSASLDRMTSRSSDHLVSTMANLATVTETFAETREELKSLITNLSELTSSLKEADLGSTLAETKVTVASTNELLDGLKQTVTQVESSFDQVNDLLLKVETGEGTIGKLLNDPEIYHNLEATSKHLALLLQDLRLNPKRYVRLSVFGRKDKPYTNPEDDPAFDIELKAPTSSEGN